MDTKSLCGDYSRIYGFWFQLKNYLYNDCTIYLDRKYKLYEFFKNGSRSVQEWTELSSSKIGESSVEGNTEVIEEG